MELIGMVFVLVIVIFLALAMRQKGFNGKWKI